MAQEDNGNDFDLFAQQFSSSIKKMVDSNKALADEISGLVNEMRRAQEEAAEEQMGLFTEDGHHQAPQTAATPQSVANQAANQMAQAAAPFAFSSNVAGDKGSATNSLSSVMQYVQQAAAAQAAAAQAAEPQGETATPAAAHTEGSQQGASQPQGAPTAPTGTPEHAAPQQPQGEQAHDQPQQASQGGQQPQQTPEQPPHAPTHSGSGDEQPHPTTAAPTGGSGGGGAGTGQQAAGAPSHAPAASSPSLNSGGAGGFYSMMGQADGMVTGAVRSIPVVGGALAGAMSIASPSRILKEVQQQRDKDDWFRQANGGSHLDAIHERADQFAWTHKPGFMGGAGMVFNDRDAAALYQSATRMGMSNRDPSGGNDRDEYLEYAKDAKNTRGQGVQETQRQGELWRRNAHEHNTAYVNTSLDTVSDMAGRAGLNAQGARDDYMGYYESVRRSGAGGSAANISGDIQSRNISMGRNFAQDVDSSALTNTRSTTNRMAAAVSGMTPGQFAMEQRHNTDRYRQSQDKLAQMGGQATGLPSGTDAFIQQYKEEHPDAQDNPEVADAVFDWLVEHNFPTDPQDWADSYSAFSGQKYQTPQEAMADYIKHSRGEGYQKAHEDKAAADKRTARRNVDENPASLLVKVGQGTGKGLEVGGTALSRVGAAVPVLGSAGKVISGIGKGVSKFTDSVGGMFGKTDKHEGAVDTHGQRTQVAEEAKKNGITPDEQRQRDSQVPAALQRIGLTPEAAKLLKVLEVSGDDPYAASKAAASGQPLHPTTNGSR